MPELIRISTRSVPAILFCLLAFNSQAAMYKWVDEDGVTHYTQQPPPSGLEGQEIKPDPAMSGTDGEAQEKLKKMRDSLQPAEESEEAKTAQEDKEYEKKRQQWCKQARARLQTLQRPRVSYVSEDGSAQRLPEEQRQKELNDLQGQIKKNCN